VAGPESPSAAASVRIGAYRLEVSGGAGSFAQFDGDEEDENARELAAALDEPERPPAAVAAIEEFEETADEVTGRIEKADEYLRSAAAGELLDLHNLTGEIDSLLDLCARLDKQGRFDEELKLMRSLNGLLALCLRWWDLIRSLRALLRSATDARHAPAQAFAHHELGSLHLCAGQPAEAAQHLGEALRLEDVMGDLAGRCATRHNLDSSRRDLAMRSGGGVPAPKRIQRLVIFAGALAIAGGSGAGIALAIHGSGGDEHSTTSPPPPPPPGKHVLTVALAGKGAGSVRGRGIRCPSDCRASIQDGQTVILTAIRANGSVLTSWSRPDCGRAARCKVTVSRAITVTATFERAADEQPPTAPTDLRAVAVNANQINLSWVKSTDNAAVTGYVIYRDRLKLTTVSATSTVYRDTGLAPSTGYVYSVQAVDAAGNASPQSNLTKATTLPPSDKEPPSAPTGLRATAVGSTEVDLTWTASADNVAVTGYVIFRDGVELTTVAGTATSYQDTGLDPSTGYVYWIEAVDAAGNRSAQSNKTKASTGLDLAS
jgi:chitodextrinase